MYDAVWGTGRILAQAGGRADAEASTVHPWLEGTDGELGRSPAVEPVQAAVLLDPSAFSELQPMIVDPGKAQTGSDMISEDPSLLLHPWLLQK